MNQSIENRGHKIAFTDAAARRVKRINARLLYAKRTLYSENFRSCPLLNSIVICIIASLSVDKKAIKNLQHYTPFIFTKFNEVFTVLSGL